MFIFFKIEICNDDEIATAYLLTFALTNQITSFVFQQTHHLFWFKTT